MGDDERLQRLRGPSWWLRCIAHNVVVHPWLPLADALDACGYRTLPRAIYWAHDLTAEGLEGGG